MSSLVETPIAPISARKERPRRVCFLIDRLRPAGTERQLLALIDRLDRSRIQPTLCLLDGEDALSRSLEPSDCIVRRLGIKSLSRWGTLAKGVAFARYLRHAQVDVVQLHFPDSTYFGVPFSRLGGVPNILCTRRDLGYWMDCRHRVLGRICNRLSHVTIANCDAAKAAVSTLDPAEKSKVVVLHNGVDCTRFADIPPLAQQIRLRRQQTVGIVANLRRIKNLPIFVHAAATLAKQFPAAQFVIAGEGEERARLDRLVVELGLTDRVHMPGAVVDLPGLLATFDVATLCSDSEGLSNALLEYMAAGRPVVATRVGGNVELICQGVNGLLVPPADPAALSAAVGRLLSDSAWASALGEAARRTVCHNFSLDAAARRTEEFYCRLPQRHPSKSSVPRTHD